MAYTCYNSCQIVCVPLVILQVVIAFVVRLATLAPGRSHIDVIEKSTLAVTGKSLKKKAVSQDHAGVTYHVGAKSRTVACEKIEGHKRAEVPGHPVPPPGHQYMAALDVVERYSNSTDIANNLSRAVYPALAGGWSVGRPTLSGWGPQGFPWLHSDSNGDRAAALGGYPESGARRMPPCGGGEHDLRGRARHGH
eukprot:691437-Pyramimonas_sp.AAC.1